MRVLVLGVGDAFTRLHFGTSALLEGPDGFVLLDCPDLVHRALHEASARAGWKVDAMGISDILLTHLHGDHCNGLESFGFAHAYPRSGAAPADTRPRIHTSRPVADRLWERLAPAMDEAGSAKPRTLDDYYDLRILEPGTTATIAGLEVQCRFTQHPIPTIGLLISDGDKTLGWSGDTLFEQAHIEWLSGADVIVHEANRGHAHTSVEDLNTLPAELQRKIRLVHIFDDFDQAATKMTPLREGEVLEL